MFAFTKKQPLFVDTTHAARWSTEAYDKENLLMSMPVRASKRDLVRTT